MAVEAISLFPIGILPLIAIAYTVKESIRKEHPQYGQERIEVCHIEPRFAGGTGKRTNLMPQTLPEHALQHLNDAVSSDDWETAKANYCATHMIVGRMTESEFNKFSQMMATRKRRK